MPPLAFDYRGGNSEPKKSRRKEPDPTRLFLFLTFGTLVNARSGSARMDWSRDEDEGQPPSAGRQASRL